MEASSLLPELLRSREVWLTLFTAYILGAIPFGLIITKFFLGFDVRDQGSGNIGMTNVMRTAGKVPGIATFLLDFGKGFLAVFLVFYFFEQPPIVLALAGFFAVFGHTRSIFLSFTGGKGVATNFGVWAILDWRIFVLSALTWAVIFGLKKVSSLSALCSLIVLPIIAASFHGLTPLTAAAILLSTYIILLHKENIIRLVSGEEGALKAKKES
ncbi:MAG: glycerol-3-phosphate 1-O-acyltransferase PlsY [SAR324 cluster bacterium]|nr:glycerol-3-phosphate 1-O-acyltransferase PlsY [SAR324 cluster bacterium]